MLNKWIFSVLLGLSISVCFAQSTLPLDTFGISMFYETKTGTQSWNSAHWGNGIARTIRYAPDPHDPTDWTEDHSASTQGFIIDGQGMMSMAGGPRFHINSLRTKKVPAQFFLNTEFTAYYRRIGSGGKNWGGMVVGARSGALGHASSGGDDCDGTTYYARFRHDGKWDFEKELKHPTSSYWSTGGYNTQTPLWGGSPLPENRWIGMKYLTYNIENNTKVKLELYIDSISNGTPVNGGHWEKVFELVDEGNWPVPGGTGGCSYTDEKYIINPGQGTFLMRTDDAGADYKMVSIREIDLDKATTSIPQSNPSIKQSKPAKMQLEIRPPSMRTKSNESIKKVNLQGAKAR